MLNILKKFFDFVGEENKKKFRISIVLSVFQALSAAMKIPAIMLILQAIMANRLTDTVIWQASGIMLGGLLVENIVKYKASRKIIDGISLRIPEKTTTAIVGPSGGGKTTLCNLIARFWDVDSGSVTLDGHDVREYSVDSLMKNFSFVFQSVYLFSDTIANNIRFGKEDASIDEVVLAAKKACCHEFIMELPQGYDTVIGEGEATLSGGERQRISIARAIMKDAPIIILDEATANVDPENEKELIGAIESLTREKTIIMIAHRLKTVRNADQIVVVNHGKIEQLGTHEDLMCQEGIYRRFVDSRELASGWKL